jgi:bacteriocin biosynthesis cyclodehydratase domain-containing protein
MEATDRSFDWKEEMLGDPGAAFPRRPRLVPDLHVLLMADGLGVQFRGAGAPVILRGAAADEALPFLLRAMDGSRSWGEIVSGRPPEVPREAVIRCLATLHAKGLLRGDDPAPAAKEPVLARQSLFWGRHLALARGAASAADVEARLGATRLVLVGGGLFGAATYDVLARSGLGPMRVLAWDDAEVLPEALAASPLPPRGAAVLPTTSVGAAESALRPWLADADLLVTATRNAPRALLAAVNRFCLERRVPWLRANEAGGELDLGPLVVPFASACHTCLTLREASTLEEAIEEEIHQEALAEERPAGTTPPLGESIAGAVLAAGLVASEVVRIVTKLAPPSLLNAVLRVSLLGGAQEKSRLLRVPRCADCYPGSRPEARHA